MSKSCQLPAADFVPPHCSAHPVWLPSTVTLTLRSAPAGGTLTLPALRLAPSSWESCHTRPLGSTWRCCRRAPPPWPWPFPLQTPFCSQLLPPASREGSSSQLPAQKQTPPTAVTGAAATHTLSFHFLPSCREFSWFCDKGSLQTVCHLPRVQKG